MRYTIILAGIIIFSFMQVVHASDIRAIEKTEEFATQARNSINESMSVVSHEKLNGVNLTHIEILVSQAKQELDYGDVIKAKYFADQASTFAKQVAESKNAIDEAIFIISQEKMKGFQLASIDNLIFQANHSFYDGDYSTAKYLAEQAKEKALDIDGDGVSNDYDFAPAINNYYIYSGFALFLIGSVLTFKTVRRMKEKLKIERQRLAEKRQREEEEKKRQESASREAERREQERMERERNKAEEEKCRQEEEERQRKEKMKRKILDRIDEVTRNE